MTRPSLEVADIVRTHGSAFLDRNPGWFTFQHLKVYRAITSHAGAGRPPGSVLPMRLWCYLVLFLPYGE